MWVYPSSIGLLKIVKIQGAYYFMFDNDETVWTGHTNPHVVADDVYCHATGCDV